MQTDTPTHSLCLLFLILFVFLLCTWNDASQTRSQHSMYGAIICVSIRDNVCTFNWAHRRRRNSNNSNNNKEKRKKVAYKRIKLAGGSKASRFYDLHPPLFLMTKKGLVQLLSMYKHTLTHTERTKRTGKAVNLIVDQNKPVTYIHCRFVRTHTHTHASVHTTTQFEKCSNHQFEYKTYERSLFLSDKTYKYDTHVACVSLKPMRMLSRAYYTHQTSLSLSTAHTHTHMWIVLHVRLTNISVTMCFCLRTIQSKKRFALALSLCVYVLAAAATAAVWNDSVRLLSEYQQLRALAGWLADWMTGWMSGFTTEWDGMN